jgi:hypothetical protein
VGQNLVVDHQVRVLVKVLFVTAYRYEADRTETWEIGDSSRLVFLKTHTNDNGTMLDVVANRGDEGVEIKGSAGALKAPADTSVPGPGWQVLTPGKHQLIDPDRGKIVSVSVSAPVEETIAIGARKIKCQKIQLTGGEEATQWFGADGVLVKERLKAPDGSWVETTLQ